MPQARSHRRNHDPHANMYSDGDNKTQGHVNQHEKEEEGPRGEMFSKNITSNEIQDTEYEDDQDYVASEEDYDKSVPVGKIENENLDTVENTDVPMVTAVLETTAVFQVMETTVLEETTSLKTPITTTPMSLEIATPSPNHKWIPLFWQQVCNSIHLGEGEGGRKALQL